MEMEYKWNMPNAEVGACIVDDPSIAASIVANDVIRMCATYYDTPAQDVHHMGGGLRIRQENDEVVCCLKLAAKSADGCKIRQEFEVEASEIVEGLTKLPGAGAPQDVCEKLIEGGPEPTCVTDFIRHAYTLELEACVAELAIDEGEMRHDGRTAPIHEIELEYKSGDQEAFHAFAQNLQRDFDLTVQQLSKLARAMSL